MQPITSLMNKAVSLALILPAAIKLANNQLPSMSGRPVWPCPTPTCRQRPTAAFSVLYIQNNNTWSEFVTVLVTHWSSQLASSHRYLHLHARVTVAMAEAPNRA